MACWPSSPPRPSWTPPPCTENYGLKQMADGRMRNALALCILLLLTVPLAGQAAQARPYVVSLPSAPLSRTMFAISKLTGVEIAFADPRLMQIRSRRVTGTYPLRLLLDRVTEGTDADYRFIGDKTVMIVARARPEPRPRTIFSIQNRGSSQPQTIVVTANKRSQFLSDLPMSTASYSQAAMDELGLNDMRAIARVTPGVLYRNAWGGSTNLSIRGIYSNTGSATTGVYIDDTPVQTRSLGAGVTSTNVYPALFDLERVEVLRGPQGALFGSGSEGGTIRFIGREPDLEKTSGTAALEGFMVRGGAPGYEASAAVGGPIIPDMLGYRLSLFSRQDGGWIDRVRYPGGEMIDEDSNSLVVAGVRGALAYKPSDTVTITPSVFYQYWSQRDTDQFWSLFSDIDAGRFRTGARFAQPTRDTFLLANLKVVADLGDMTLLSTTSYFRRRRPSTVDYTDYMVEMLSRGTRFALDELPAYQLVTQFENNPDVFTQEFRLTSADDARIRWLGGLFIQRARQDAVEYIHEPLLNEALSILVGQSAQSYFGAALLPDGVSYVGKDRSIDWQFGLFGEVVMPLWGNVEMSAGGRLARMQYRQTNYQDGPQSGGHLESVVSHGETPILPRFGLNWRPRKGQLFYANAARGTRIGGGNAQVSFTRCGTQLTALGLDRVPDNFTSDSIWNYEVGAKVDLPWLRGSLHAAAYHFVWRDIQQSYSLRCLFRYTANNAQARGDGIDLTLYLAPLPGLSASIAGSYARARYTQTVYGGIIDTATGERAVVIPAGQALPAPKWRLSGVVRYDWRVRDDLSFYATLSGDYSAAYEQGYALGAVDYDPTLFVSDAVGTARLQLGARFGPFDASLYADNLLDSRDILQATHNSRRSINMRYVITRPRALGLRLTYSFQ
ncbi:TonB-dependent receptor [soil metagenome]